MLTQALWCALTSSPQTHTSVHAWKVILTNTQTLLRAFKILSCSLAKRPLIDQRVIAKRLFTFGSFFLFQGLRKDKYVDRQYPYPHLIWADPACCYLKHLGHWRTEYVVIDLWICSSLQYNLINCNYNLQNIIHLLQWIKCTKFKNKNLHRDKWKK